MTRVSRRYKTARVIMQWTDFIGGTSSRIVIATCWSKKTAVIA